MAEQLPTGFHVKEAPAEGLPPGFRVKARSAAPASPQGGYVQPAPPPGVIIHDAGRSYISDRPEISTERDPQAGERENAIAMQSLRARGQSDDSVAGTISRRAQPLTQGLSLGFGDELISAIFGGTQAVAGGSFDDAFDYAQDYQRQELDQQREEQPLTSLGLEATGGTATSAGLAAKGVTAVGRMANKGLRNILPRMGAGAAEGAAYGGAYGLGTAEGNIAQRAAEADDDALIGAIFGTAAVPVVDAVMGAGGQFVRNGISALRNPEKHAEDQIVAAIMRDRTTPAVLADDVAAAVRAGQPEFAAIDAGGRNMQRLGAMAAKTPGEFRETAATTFARRQQGQGDRIGSYVDEAVGDGSAAFSTEQQLLASRRAAAEPLYAEAYRAPPPRGAFYDDMLTRQSVRDAMRAAEKTAAERQIPVSDLFVDIPNPNAVSRQVPAYTVGADGKAVTRTVVDNPTIRIPTMRGWDLLKRELDARVNQLYQAGDTTAATAVKETRNALRSQLGADNGAYGRALAQYSDDSSALEAIQTGRDFAKARNTDEAQAAFGGLSEGERALARTGASREIGVTLENMRTGQDKTLPFDTPNMDGKLDLLIEDPTARAVFGQRLDRERGMVRSNRQMQGGSNTFENFADAGGVREGVLQKLARGNVGGAVLDAAGQMLGFVGRAAQGMNEDVANQVGRYLLSADPNEIRRLTEAFDAAGRGSTDRGQFIARLLAAAGAMLNEQGATIPTNVDP